MPATKHKPEEIIGFGGRDNAKWVRAFGDC